MLFLQFYLPILVSLQGTFALDYLLMLYCWDCTLCQEAQVYYNGCQNDSIDPFDFTDTCHTFSGQLNIPYNYLVCERFLDSIFFSRTSFAHSPCIYDLQSKGFSYACVDLDKFPIAFEFIVYLQEVKDLTAAVMAREQSHSYLHK